MRPGCPPAGLPLPPPPSSSTHPQGHPPTREPQAQRTLCRNQRALSDFLLTPSIAIARLCNHVTSGVSQSGGVGHWGEGGGLVGGAQLVDTCWTR